MGEDGTRAAPTGEALGPGTTSPMRLNVGSGSYAFRCLFEDFDPLTGPTVTVGGGSFDAIAGSMTGRNGLFNFFAPHFRPVILDPTTGAVVKS